jgi:hypothetical protein
VDDSFHALVHAAELPLVCGTTSDGMNVPESSSRSTRTVPKACCV